MPHEAYGRYLTAWAKNPFLVRRDPYSVTSVYVYNSGRPSNTLSFNKGALMRTKFWRFAYKEEALNDILASSSLAFPDLSRWPQAKNYSEEAITADLRVGHFVLLANFNSTAETGTVRGVGRIESIEDSIPKVQWKRPVPSWILQPDRRGGVPQWKKEGVFCFDVNPAKRYKLDALTKKLFPED